MSGIHHPPKQITAAERVEWARRELERAVSLMKVAPHDLTMRTAVISRFDDLETARAAQRRAEGKSGATDRCHACGRANRGPA